MSDSVQTPTPATVLVVDDDEGIQNVLRLQIEEAGHRVICCSSGSKGLERVREAPVTGILSDLRMANGDGLNFLRRLQGSGILTPVAFITGYVEVETLIEAVRFGAIDFLQKPFSALDLTALVNRLVAIGSRQQKIRDILTTVEHLVDPQLIAEIKDLERQIAMLRVLKSGSFVRDAG